jgi:hypothetical protein
MGFYNLFFFACCLAGLLPYRRLVSLEKNPNKIIVIGNNTIQYWSGDKIIVSISQKNIVKLSYQENNICIQLKNESFFFSSFSQNSFEELSELISNSKELEN